MGRLLILLLAASSAHAGATLETTPGVINPNVTQANIGQTICVPGWTKTIRPPTSYTNKLKYRQMQDGALPLSARDYELDHLIPLSIGGHPTSPDNLWPQPWKGEYGAHRKDVLENVLHRLVCSGKLPLADARRAIAGDWKAAYQLYVAD